MQLARGAALAAVVLGLLASPLGAPWAAGPDSRVDPALAAALARADSSDPIGVIVRFTGRVDPAALSAGPRPARRAALVRELRRRTAEDAVPLDRWLSTWQVDAGVPLWLVNGRALTAPAGLIPRIAGLPGVESVALDRRFAAPIEEPRIASNRARGTARSSSTPEWNVERIGAPQLWALGLSGSGVVIGIMDSGVDAAHQELAPRWRGGDHGWFDPHGEHETPYDRTGHGTAVAAVIVGGEAGGTALGVAPGAQWIAVKLFDDAGTSTLSAIHQGFQWMLDPDGNPETDDAADVVNNSWGLTDAVGECVLEFAEDLELLRAAGIAVVFSGGNSGPLPGTSLSPANNPGVPAVGSVDFNDSVASSSSRGPSSCDGAPYPEVVAPGVEIWTADLTLGGLYVDGYQFVSGTSFAAPHVSGVVALLRQAFPEATVAQLDAALVEGALDLGTPGPDHDSGWGRIDALEAHATLVHAPSCGDADRDGHLAGDADCLPHDCDDSDAGIWSVPGEVPGLTFGSDTSVLSWSPPSPGVADAGSVRYDTLRTVRADDFGSAASCIESDDGTDTLTADGDRPPPGVVFSYLVRAENDCGSGSLGHGFDGLARTARACP
jgi:bacillopeptidase F